MYEIQFRKHALETNDHPLVSGLHTLKEAKEARTMSGDLVIDSMTKKVVVSDEWLADWEKADRRSYAHRAVLAQLHINLVHAGISEADKNDPGPSVIGRMCWVYSHPEFDDIAVKARVFNYTIDVDPMCPRPYLAFIAGSVCSFMYARPIEFGHPTISKEIVRALSLSESKWMPISELEHINNSPVKELILEVLQ